MTEPHLQPPATVGSAPDGESAGAGNGLSAGSPAGAAATQVGPSTGRRRGDRLVAVSESMRSAVDQASAIARSSEAVLLTGPSGSGRRTLARAIHQWSGRAAGPLVSLSIVGIGEADQIAELFGNGTAASTGAFGRAQSGTLLIEAVDHLSPAAFARLGDAIRESAESATSARVVATLTSGSEVDLSAMPAHSITLAPLADRKDDILSLAAHFLVEYANAEPGEPIGFSSDARRWLVEETWSGNVQELRERIHQAIQLSNSGSISAESLMLATENDEVPSFKEAKRAFETRYVEGLLRRCAGNISRAARMAKKDRKDFYDVIRRTGVDTSQFRG
ncbi:MAG: sigma 54-interacting transcriptional regulator [Myxococcota bacterium]